MKKSILVSIVLAALVACLACAGCGSSAPKEDPTLGSTFTFDGFEITLGDSVTTMGFPNQYSPHANDTVVVVPAKITNNNKDSGSINMFFVEFYGSQGKKLDTIFTYFEDDPLWNNDLRSGASADVNFHMLYDGNGEYVIEFEKSSEKVEVKIPVEL